MPLYGVPAAFACLARRARREDLRKPVGGKTAEILDRNTPQTPESNTTTMPYEVVAEQVNTYTGSERRDYTSGRLAGGNSTQGAPLLGGGGGGRRFWLSTSDWLRCMCFSILAGIVLVGMAIGKFADSMTDTRGKLIKDVDDVIDTWAKSKGPQFTSGYPYAFGGAAGGTQKLASSTAATTAKSFGEPVQTVPGWNSYAMTLVGAMGGTPIPPIPLAPMALTTGPLDIKTDAGASAVGGEFTLNLYKETISSWNCQVDTYGEGVGGTVCHGNAKSCGLNLRSDGCPNNQPRWAFGGSTQWVRQKVKGKWKCLDYASCFCMCTGGRNKGARIPDSYYPGGYNPWTGQFLPAQKANCLDLSRQYCGTPSKAAMVCNTEPIRTTPCRTQCSLDGGVYIPTSLTPVNPTWWGAPTLVDGSATCMITQRDMLSSVCLMKSASVHTAPVLADGLPGCIWNGDRLVSTRYTALPPGRPRPTSTTGFLLTVKSPNDPTFAAGKLTKPPYCNLKPSPNECLGLTVAQNRAYALAFIIPGLALLGWPIAMVVWMQKKGHNWHAASLW